MSEKVWNKIARYYIKSGKLPIRVSNVITDILKTLVTLEQAEFIAQLRKHSYNLDELKTLTNMEEASLLSILNDLMDIGVLTGIRSRRTGVTVYEPKGRYRNLGMVIDQVPAKDTFKTIY